MPELKLYSSNRLEILADKLALELEKPLKSPITPEIIVVQSNGMKRWLSLELSGHFGVWANCRFLFPNVIAGEIFQAVLPDTPKARIFDIETMTWRLMKIIPECLDGKDFGSLKYYLDDTISFIKLYQLSSKLADVFDQYLTYRPEMILSWDSGKENHWQAALWRALSETLASNHPPAVLKSFLEKAADKKYMSGIELPERISVFGISAMPKFHMNILTSLAPYIDVNLFLMNPSRQYWAEIRSGHAIAKSAGKKSADTGADHDLYMEKGNSLLASMGRTGRDFLWILLEYYNPSDYSCFSDPGSGSILHSIQSDILDMTDRGAPGDESQIALSAGDLQNDNSVTISSCHSPSRETEVLYDYILNIFNSDPEIGPDDILVMTPDIETYSPFIQAVFGSFKDDGMNIPYSITDMSLRKEFSIIDTFISLLDISGSRFEASRVLGILECGDIAGRFNITADEIEIIRKWVLDTNIRWGINADEKKKLGLPGENLNTWEEGFKRLLAGYALPVMNDTLFNDILPYDNIEGSETRILGMFIHYFNTLKTFTGSLERNRSLKEWRDDLIILIDNIFFQDENNTELQTLKNMINRLASIQDDSGFDGKIDLPVIKSFLNNASRRESTGAGFLTGKVTFCTMLPMRSIPYKVICLIGMNGDSFPRVTRTPNFNLISKNPQRGDRSQRFDDRYIFLESILSAREKLYISHIGQSIQDNSEIPPSAVVSELLDYIEQAFISQGISIRDSITAKHRLQPFSPSYFKADKKLFTYSEENFNACFSMLNAKKNPEHFISGRLDRSDEPISVIELNSLLAFYRNPAKYLIRKKLGIYLEEYSGTIEDREPFSLDGLGGYNIGQELVDRIITNRDIGSYHKIIRSSGILPQGNIGDIIFKDMIPGARGFIRDITPYIDNEKIDPYLFDIDIRGFRLTGEIGSLRSNGSVHYRFADVKARDMMNTWITHLIINASQNDSILKNSRLLCKNHFYEFTPVDNSMDILFNLIKIFIAGQNQLLHFFTETSYEYARRIFEGKSPDAAIESARIKWKDNNYGMTEIDDSYYYLCFNKTDPLDENFRRLAEEIYSPILACARKI